MPYYLDTSVLMALYRTEPLTAAIEGLLDEAESAPVISTLTQVEATSVLSRWVRTAELGKQDAYEIEQTLAGDLNAQALISVPFHDGVYWQARNWLGRYDSPLRGLDALHLACAAEHRLTLVTADRALARAADTLKASAQLLVAE